MSVDQIAVASEFLHELADRLQRTSNRLRGGTGLQALGFEGFEETRSAFVELQGKWDERRDNLGTALSEGGRSIRGVVDAFVRVDEALAAELRKDD